MKRAPVIAGGAGDSAAGAVRLRRCDGDAFVSLGVGRAVGASAFPPAPARRLLPRGARTWHQMG